jgi:hypothetical protein
MSETNTTYTLEELEEYSAFNEEQKEFLKDFKFEYIVNEKSVSNPPDDLPGYPIYNFYRVLKVRDDNNRYLGTISIAIEVQGEGLIFPPEIKIVSDIDSFPMDSKSSNNQSDTNDSNKKYISIYELDSTIKESLSYNEVETLKNLYIYDTNDISFQDGYKRYQLHLENSEGKQVGYIEIHFNMNEDNTYSDTPTDIHIEPRDIVLSDSDLIIKELGLEEDKAEYDKGIEFPDRSDEDINRYPSNNVEYFSIAFGDHLFCPKCRSLTHISHWEYITFTREYDSTPDGGETENEIFKIACPICGESKEIDAYDGLAIEYLYEKEREKEKGKEKETINTDSKSSSTGIFEKDNPFGDPFEAERLVKHDIFNEDSLKNPFGNPFGNAFKPFKTKFGHFGDTDTFDDDDTTFDD